MYIINGNSIRNNQRDNINRAQKEWLKSKYGENYKEGIKRDPTVTTDPDYAKRNRERMEAEKSKQANNTIKSSIQELASKRSISGQQAARLERIADDL